MLNIAQLEKIRKQNAFLYETLQQIVNAVNSLGRQVGIDPTGVTAGGSAAPVQQTFQGTGTATVSGQGYGGGGPRSLGPVRQL